MSDKVKLVSLTVVGFRGFVGEQTIEFDRSPVFLLGDNGTGKSSVLGAIEWCLFGDVAKIPQHRSNDQEDIQNPKSERLDGTLLLISDDEEYRVTRHRVPGKSTMTELSIASPSGEELRGEEAEQGIFQLLRLTQESFTRSVYLHQESIRDLLTEDLKSRNEAMDRLLGLDGPKELLEAMSDGIRTWKKESTRQQNAYSEIKQRVEGRIQEVQARITQSKGAVAEKGLDPENVEIGVGRSLVSDAWKVANILLKEAGQPEVDTPIIQDHKELGGSSDLINALIRTVRNAFPETKQISSLVTRRTEAEEHKTLYSGRLTRWQQAEKDLDTFLDTKGNREKLRARIAKSKTNIEKLTNERRELNARLLVIKDAISYIQDMGSIVCPICGNEIADGADRAKHLRQEMKGLGREELEKLDKKLDSEKQRQLTAEEDLSDLERLEDEEAKTHKKVDEKVVEISEFLGKPIEPNADPIPKISAEIGKLTKEIRNLREPLSAREARLTEIEQIRSQVEAAAKLLEERDRLENLAGIEKSKEMRALKKSVGSIEERIFVADEIVKGIGRQQESMAKEILSACQSTIQDYYQKLCDHPHYDNLRIDVSSKELKSGFRNEYEINVFNTKEKSNVSAAPKLSTGQLNSVALSVFLAMSMEDAYTHNLDLVLIDDPSQNLDGPHMLALRDVLGEVAKKTNLVVASHDPEFRAIIEDSFSAKQARIYQFGSYDPNSGPVMNQV